MQFLNFFIVILFFAFINASENEKVVEKGSDSEGMCTGKGPEDCSEKKDEKQDEEVKTSSEKKDEKQDEEVKTSSEKKDEKQEEVKTSSKIVVEEDKNRSEEEMEAELNKEQTEEQEYLKGSACSYCSYCKFCKLCDKDCPCETSRKKPNCAMCKYCKYCYLCKGCDTICQPGGVIDRFTSYVSNHLPKFNKEQVDEDIEKVKDYIDGYKDEL